MGVLNAIGGRRAAGTLRRAAGVTALVASLAAGAATVVAEPTGAGAVTADRTGLVSTVAARPTCGPQLPKSGGGYWTCTLDDEFSSTRLDTTKWQTYTSAPGGFVGGDECYSPNNVTLDSGNLRLTATKQSTAFTCAGRSTNYRSGLILSKGRFAQAYGRFEMRAMTPAGVGFQPAFWLLPENPYTQPGGYTYGEIDVMEAWGQYPGLASPHLHYVQTPGTLQSGAYCSVPSMTTSYHTYAVEWTSSKMTFIYDGKTCWSTTWKPIARYQPAGSVAPSPFNQKFYVIVNLAMGGPATPGNRATSTTKFPSRMSVDYVRVWR